MKMCHRFFERRRLFHTFSSLYLGSNSPKWIEPKGHMTGINVYNSAMKSKVPLILKNTDCASWYMCGPTVYDAAHIGHACCYVKFDIIRRILQNFYDINVVVVMGITDIDDKIIKRAHSLKEDFRVVSNKYENEFCKDMCDLHVLPPTITVRVSDVIPSIIAFIDNILNTGMAYKMDDGSVYFSTSKFKPYGKLYPVVQDSASSIKKSGNDFALWKAAKTGEPYWESPWGKGRPGWHIECSTIASNILGSTVDLHSGGIDLLFPHHENEEAQSCVYHGVEQWVNYWLHAGHLHLKGNAKMSKSLKNTISIQQFLDSHSADDFRMYCLLSRYRNDVEYSDKTFAHARGVYKKIQSFLSDCNAYVRGTCCDGQIEEAVLLEKLASTRQNFLAALADDFDTTKAIGVLMEFISDTNIMLHAKSGEIVSRRNPGVIAAASTFVQQVIEKLGVNFVGQESSLSSNEDTSRIMDMVVDFRNEVREFALQYERTKMMSVGNERHLLTACDKLRERLSVIGFEIKDHGHKSSWNMKQR